MRHVISCGLAVCALLAPGVVHAADGGESTSPPEAVVGRRIHGVVSGGASYGNLFGLELGAAAMDVGVTFTRSRWLAITVAGDARIGKTLTGTLAFGDIGTSCTFDAILDRVRLGIGPQLSYFWIGRARDSDLDRVDTFTVGLRGRVSIDLVHFDDDGTVSRRGLYLELAPRLEKFLGPNGFAWHAGAGGGVRF